MHSQIDGYIQILTKYLPC